MKALSYVKRVLYFLRRMLWFTYEPPSQGPTFRCLRCGAEFEREHHTCRECGAQFVAEVQDEP